MKFTVEPFDPDDTFFGEGAPSPLMAVTVDLTKCDRDTHYPAGYLPAGLPLSLDPDTRMYRPDPAGRVRVLRGWTVTPADIERGRIVCPTVTS